MGNLKEENFHLYYQQDSVLLKRVQSDSTLLKPAQIKDPIDLSHRGKGDSVVSNTASVLDSNYAIKKTEKSKAKTAVLENSISGVKTGSTPVLGSDRVSYSADTIFELPIVGSYDFTIKSKVLLDGSSSSNLFKVTSPMVSIRESDNFNAFSGRTYYETTNNQSNSLEYIEKPIPHFSFNTWLLFGLIVSLSASIILFRRYNEKVFGLILLSAINIREAERFFTSKTSLYRRILAITNTLFISSVCLAIFNYLTLVFSSFESTVKSFFILGAVVLGYLIYRNLLLSVFSVVSNRRDFFSSLSFHHFIFNFLMTLMLLFFGVLSTYLPYELRLFPLYGSFFGVIILLIMRSIRSFHVFILNRFSIFYWILYFCALELVPLAFLFYGLKRLVIIA